MSYLEYPERGRKFREHMDDGGFKSLLTHSLREHLISAIFLTVIFLGIGYFKGAWILFDSLSVYSVTVIFTAITVFSVFGMPLANLVASLAMYPLLSSEGVSFEEVLAATVYGRLFSRAPGFHILLRDEVGVGRTRATVAALVGGSAVLIIVTAAAMPFV